MRPYFTEKPLYSGRLLPGQRRPAQNAGGGGRDPEQYGLPLAGKFVFCSFNNNYKITPEMFGSWMRILREVPEGILWLLRDNEWAEANMQSAARAYGVDPDRLFFCRPRDAG